MARPPVSARPPARSRPSEAPTEGGKPPRFVRKSPVLFFFTLHVLFAGALAAFLRAVLQRTDPVTSGLLFVATSQATAFLFFAWDKRLAIRNRFRIPEASLLAAAWLFGSVGAAFAMVLFRHKTSRPVFWFGVGTALVIHAIVLSSLLA